MALRAVGTAIAAALAISAPGQVVGAMQDPTAPSKPQPIDTRVVRTSQRIDFDRIFSDPAHAEDFLRDVPSFELAKNLPLEQQTVLAGLRAVGLTGAGRGEEAKAEIDRVIGAGARDPGPYMLAWMAAAHLGDRARAVAIVESAVPNVPADKRDQLYPVFPPAAVGQLYGVLSDSNEPELRRRLGEAVVALGWPGRFELDTRDEFRMEVIADRIERGDRAGAAPIAQSVDFPHFVLQLAVARRYDGLLATGDPAAAVMAAAERYERLTADALAAYPDVPRVRLNRAYALRSLGRADAALALLAPYAADVERAASVGEDGLWLVHEAAQALDQLGRRREAIALLERLIGLGLDSRPVLIGPAINLTEMLRRAGRAGESLRLAESIERGHTEDMTPMGLGRLRSTIACAQADLGRTADAARTVETLRASRSANNGAYLRALLCVEDFDSAEREIVSRLDSERKPTLLVAFQIFELSRESERSDPLHRRLERLRGRPAVAAALDRAGRVVSVPLARLYWGGL